MYRRQLEQRTFLLEKIPVAGKVQAWRETLIETVGIFSMIRGNINKAL